MTEEPVSPRIPTPPINIPANTPYVMAYIPRHEGQLDQWEPGWLTKASAISTGISALISSIDPSVVPVVEILAAGTVVLWLIEAGDET